MSTVAPMGSNAQCAAQAVLGPLRGFMDRLGPARMEHPRPALGVSGGAPPHCYSAFGTAGRRGQAQQRCAFAPYLALSTATNWFCASSGVMSVFQNLVITSATLPYMSGAMSMLGSGV